MRKEEGREGEREVGRKEGRKIGRKATSMMKIVLATLSPFILLSKPRPSSFKVPQMEQAQGHLL